MAGNKEGALKAAETNKKKYGDDFYKNIGSKSWKNPNRSRETGFALNRKLASEAGRIGGKKTKDEYKTKDVEYATAEELAEVFAETDTL